MKGLIVHSNHPIVDYKAVVKERAQFIDVREPGEVAKGTLPETLNIPVDQLSARLSELDNKRRVVVMCRSGARSTKAAEILTNAGFGDVVNLEGGMMAWDKANKQAGPRRGFLSRFR